MSTRRTKPREPRKTRRIKRAPKAKATKKARHSKARVFTRGAERPTSIVPELMGVLDQLLSLMRKTKDPQQLEQLGDQHSALSEQVERLIDRQIMETTAQYHAAIEGIQQASETIEKAIEGLESVNTVILKAAKAVQLAGKVAAMV
ncbi:MAG: hypothetical protein U0236_15405 [Nitrospira sp.]